MTSKRPTTHTNLKMMNKIHHKQYGSKSTRVDANTVRFHLTAELNRVTDPSWCVIEWGERGGDLSKDYIRLHKTTQDCKRLHKTTSDCTRLHKTTQDYTRLHIMRGD